jgi:tetratricopeptide (TPR) repeat protein
LFRKVRNKTKKQKNKKIMTNEELNQKVEEYKKKGNEHYAYGNFGKTLECYEELIKISPVDTKIYTRMGYCCQKTNVKKAIEYYLLAIEADPNNAEACHNLGSLYFTKGDYDKSIAYLGRAVSLDPKDASTRYNLGIACAHKGDYDVAIGHFEQVLSLTPNDANSYYNIGVAHSRKNDLNRTILFLRKAAQLGSKEAIACLEKIALSRRIV